MNRTIQSKFNRINLVVALFLASTFGFNAFAQDSPLNSQQLANLVNGLKGALQENLAMVENKNGTKFTAITRKWDARRDLAGKSKSSVIDLLLQDVKSVVTDFGMQYQISQVFLFYNQIPDSQFSAKTAPSDEARFTDPRDGNVYGTKRLGNLTWMTANLRFDVPNASWCFDDDEENCAELGRL